MQVELFGSKLKDYKATADQWLDDYRGFDIKYICVGLGPSGEFVTTFVFFEEKSSESTPEKKT